MSLIRILLLFIATMSASTGVADEGPRIQLLGDSLMATHMLTGRAVPNVLARTLGEAVDNNAITGAMIRGVSRQYQPGDLDWVVLNGGGNDLWLGCGCSVCEQRMSRIISPDGTEGHLPELISRIRGDGA